MAGVRDKDIILSSSTMSNALQVYMMLILTGKLLNSSFG